LAPSPVEVYDNDSRKVRAKMLVDAAGMHVRDPMTGMPLIVDEDFNIDRAISFGRSLANTSVSPFSENPEFDKRVAIYKAMKDGFQPGGPLEMQRSYNKMVGGGKHEFVGAFRPAASYILGVVGQAAGLTPQEIMAGAGLFYLWEKYHPRHPNPNLDTSGPMFNAPQNARWIDEGIRAYQSGRFFQPLKKQGPNPRADRLPSDAEKIDPNQPGDSTSREQESSDQGLPQNAADFGAAEPQTPNRQLAGAGQAGGPPQVGSPMALNLPQHVIDSGNYLRANGIEITPRSMYVANVLGPRGAVDLIKRTGSTSSDAVPSPDAVTGRQMLAWARQLRLGPAAPAAPDFGATAPPAPAAQARWADVGSVPQVDVSEDASLPVSPSA
jgi:hypothetical protein